jgi:hypothetical protein
MPVCRVGNAAKQRHSGGSQVSSTPLQAIRCLDSEQPLGRRKRAASYLGPEQTLGGDRRWHTSSWFCLPFAIPEGMFEGMFGYTNPEGCNRTSPDEVIEQLSVHGRTLADR